MQGNGELADQMLSNLQKVTPQGDKIEVKRGTTRKRRASEMESVVDMSLMTKIGLGVLAVGAAAVIAQQKPAPPPQELKAPLVGGSNVLPEAHMAGIGNNTGTYFPGGDAAVDVMNQNPYKVPDVGVWGPSQGFPRPFGLESGF